ncbi:MAG TPA: protease complex subunit PrcB family protein [Candidatus Acidoferrales bacterium]|nr:protease complex subunit PrcB family protein [Candidatus Acidoferrales bacterium]
MAIVIALVLTVSLAACGFSPPSYAQQGTSEMPFVTVDKGFASGIRGRKLIAIRTEKEWKDLWYEHTSISDPSLPVPPVDFHREMILVAFAGEKPSGGYRIEILEITEDSARRELRVRFVEFAPPPGAMVSAALTQPYHIVKLKRSGLPAIFVPQR